MQLNFGACCLDSRGRTGLHLVDRPIVKSSRILYLGFLRLNSRVCLDDPQIGVANRECDHIQDVLIAELGGLFSSARGAKPLDGFIAEECLADASVNRAIAEWSNDGGNSLEFQRAQSKGPEVHLLDVLRDSCAYLRQQIAKGEQSLPTSNLRVLSAFDRSEVVSQGHVDGVPESQPEILIAGWATRYASGDHGVLRFGGYGANEDGGYC